MNLHAIIPAGGAGTRLWPLSRQSRPKFLLDLTGSGRTLLQQTVRRLEPVAASVTVVTGAAHVAAVHEQLPHLRGADVLAEPSPRNSMPAIALAAGVLARRHGTDAVVGTFAADHVIADVPAFHGALARAVQQAEDGYLVTLGITPTHPATGFGYIALGTGLGEGAHLAAAFVEKPDRPTAEAYLAAGDRVWNAGIFLARAGVLLDHLRRLHPELAAHLDAVAAVWDEGGDARRAALEEHWPRAQAIAIDHALAEPLAEEGQVTVVPVEMGWDDVGDARALASHLPTLDAAGVEAPTGDGGTAVLGDASLVLSVDSPRSVVATAGRRVVVLGVPGAVVLDTPDALLVTTTEHTQRVGEAVTRLREAGDTGVL